ncbi:MAG: hypothetical protein JXB00_18715 [Bacteroidales bacterium]|nr:hypothetical protein [Bacteroidales bacterium]
MTRKQKDINLKRSNKKTITFNNLELKAIDNYCSRFKVKNRTKFMREVIITEILKRFDRHHPTLFDNQPGFF